MNKRKTVIAILAILLILSMSIIAITFVIDNDNSSKSTVTIVPVPQQTKALIPKWVETIVFKLEDLGNNLAKGKVVVADGYNDVYEAVNATDGKVDTYWEGSSNAYPNSLTVDLATATKISKIRLRLNPDSIWGKRVQTMTILGSTDNKNFKELVPSKGYQFDPKTGNLVTITLATPIDEQFVRVEFKGNTGAKAGQVAEFEVY